MLSGVNALAVHDMGNTDSIVYKVTFDEDSAEYEFMEGAELAEGEDGMAVELNGELSQYVKLEDNITSGMSGDYTISVDFLPRNEASYPRVFDLGSGTDNTMFFTYNGGGIPKFRFKGNDLFSNDLKFNLNEWNNLTITKTGTDAVMYINGKTAATSNTFFNELSLLGETNANYLGRSQYAADAYFDGMIDNFVIYDYGLSESEVKAAVGNEAYATIRYYRGENEITSVKNSALATISAETVTVTAETKNFTAEPLSYYYMTVLYNETGELCGVMPLSDGRQTLEAGETRTDSADIHVSGKADVYSVLEDGSIEKISSVSNTDVSFPQSAPEDTMETTIGVHDPSIFKDPQSGTYYVYSTGMIDIFKSDDLIIWTRTENTLPEVPDCVKEIYHHDTPEEYSNIWAPDMFYNEDDPETPYYLTCSYSDAFGQNNSSMILFKSASPEGPWEDGEILFTSVSDDEELGKVNAIDSNIAVDQETGQPYMVYGSFWQGLHMKELNDDFTVSDTSTVGERVFSRYRGIGGPEGGYIVYNEDTGYYYMLASYDSLSDTYNIRVARSKSITGPYVDQNGESVDRYDDPEDEAGSIYGYKLTGSYQFDGQTTYYGPGHNSVLYDNGEWFLVHHTRDTVGGYATLHVRMMYWNEDGWPIVMPERYAGEELETLSAELIAGTWDYISIGDNTNSMLNSHKLRLDSDMTLEYGDVSGTWTFDGKHTVTLNIGDETVTAIVSPAYDRDRETSTLMFTGTNEDNVQKWGKKGVDTIVFR